MSLRTEGHLSPGPEAAEREDEGTKTPPPQTLLPLEERATHFRDMLLERGVRACALPAAPGASGGTRLPAEVVGSGKGHSGAPGLEGRAAGKGVRGRAALCTA